MTEVELRELIALGESQGVELKGPMGLRDKSTLKIVKSSLALSNIRGGGFIVLGVREQRGMEPDLVGLTPEQLATWTQDDVADLFDEYAEPRVVFRLHRVGIDAREFVVVDVTEFEAVPVLCKRDSSATQAGACYVYPRGKAQVRAIPAEQDMRELLDLAVEKRLRSLLAQVGRAGGAVTPATEDRPPFEARVEAYFDE